MTLQELLDLRIVHDNVVIIVLNQEVAEDEKFNITRIPGRAVTKEDLIKANVREELFSYKVVSIWGSDQKFKLGIEITKPRNKEEE